MAFRTIVPMADVTADVPRDIVALWGGPGGHIVHYPLRHGTLFNIVAVFRSSAQSERGDVALTAPSWNKPTATRTPP